MTESTQVDESPDELPVYERHRALVRQTDKKFSRVYGLGGAAVLGATSLVLVIAWIVGGLSSALPWVLAPTVFLISLFVLRGRVNRVRERLRESVESYCELNDVDPGALRDYYAGDGIYPYFQSLFDRQERT